MALAFTSASTNKVTVTNPQTIGSGSAFTFYQWVYITARVTSSGTNKNGIDIQVASPSTSHDLFCFIPRATLPGEAYVATGGVPLNVWTFLATTYDETDGPRLWRGTLTDTVAELSYSARGVGSGATSADSGNLFINNRSAASSLAWGGRVAVAAWYSGNLSLGQLRDHQFRPRRGIDCQFFGIFGHNGATNVPDLSGNGRTGVITGATVADHVPLPSPFGFDVGQSYAVPAPAGGQPIMRRWGGVPGMLGAGRIGRSW